MIRWANDQDTPVLALDLPSGLDATTGEAFTPGITAMVTMTLALPKLGLKNPLKPVVGELYLADIGVPAALYSDPSLGIYVGTLFHAESVLKLN
jgi:NAD(P)H-hydrate epimerase